MPQSRRRNGRDSHAAVARHQLAGAVLLGQPAQPVRGFKGIPYLCVWSDCDRNGDNRYRIEFRNPEAPNKDMPGGKIIEVFCSERHKQLRMDEIKAGLRRQGRLR
jgi:hypothetical protein